MYEWASCEGSRFAHLVKAMSDALCGVRAWPSRWVADESMQRCLDCIEQFKNPSRGGKRRRRR